jgi:hypothetical protein
VIDPGASRPPSGLNRQHIARGHFKTFTEEAPLFGKWTGMYFWEPQVGATRSAAS